MDFKSPKPVPTPSTPLFPLSPERLNGRAGGGGGGGLPQSPSLPDLAFTKHTRQSSDVQGMVARFNSLDIRDHAEARKKDEAALRRAQMGREEAEGELRRAREEAKALREEAQAAGERERRVGERVEGLREELLRVKETGAAQQGVYEKEIRRARKEAFKASSALVKAQEELKSARNAMLALRADLEAEKTKVGTREQEAFAAQYQLVGLQEELSKEKARVKVVEEERDALKTSLKEEEVARVAAEGRIALPAETNEDDEFASPKKTRPPQQDFDKENMSPSARGSSSEIENMKEQLLQHKQRAQNAEQQVEFMKMECQFQCCSCRVAEQQGSAFVHDNGFDEDMQKIKAAFAVVAEFPMKHEIQEAPTAIPLAIIEPLTAGDTSPAELQQAIEEPGSHESDQSPIFSNFSVPAPRSRQPISKELQEPIHVETQASPIPPPQAHLPNPVTPGVHTITTTTTIPLAGLGTEADYSKFFSPSGLTREEAIELLRERRGRARSLAQTPKKTATGKGDARRDISAPEMGKENAAKTPRTASRGRGVLR